MKKYTLDTTITVTLEQVTVNLEEPASGELDLQDALMQVLQKRLVLLDIKGGRTGEAGLISTIECESIDNWNAP